MIEFYPRVVENAWLSEREKRCRLFQEPLGTDAVLQVLSNGMEWIACVFFFTSEFDIWVSFRSVLDLNAFERQNKAEGLGMVTEEGSSE